MNPKVSRNWITLDGSQACARVAYQRSDVIAIRPITEVQRRVSRRIALYEDMAKH